MKEAEEDLRCKVILFETISDLVHPFSKALTNVGRTFT